MSATVPAHERMHLIDYHKTQVAKQVSDGAVTMKQERLKGLWCDLQNA